MPSTKQNALAAIRNHALRTELQKLGCPHDKDVVSFMRQKGLHEGISRSVLFAMFLSEERGRQGGKAAQPPLGESRTGSGNGEDKKFLVTTMVGELPPYVLAALGEAKADLAETAL